MVDDKMKTVKENEIKPLEDWFYNLFLTSSGFTSRIKSVFKVKNWSRASRTRD